MDSRESELFSRFFRMETTFEENLQIGVVARHLLAEQQKQMASQAEWERKVGFPSVGIFARLSLKNFDTMPISVKDEISKRVTDLKTAALEKNDRTAQLVLLEIRDKFEKAKIHPPAGFPYLDWAEAKRK